MGLLDWGRAQFLEIIEWQDDSRDTLAWRFPVYRNEIKYGAQLTVRESQQAVFLNEGKVADVFGPGRYELTTANLPILSTLKGWKYGFQSPFKAEVIFINTRRFPDLKWGTLNPVMLRDSDFGVLRLRAFGTYALKVVEGKSFVGQLAGSDNQVLLSDLENHLRNKIVARFTDALGEAKIPALDLASNYDELSNLLGKHLNLELAEQGLGVTDLHIENISLPPEVEQALDARSKMNVIGDLNRYTQLQTADSIKTAAANPGIGGAGVGMGVGAGIGVAMGQQMANAMQPPRPAPGDAFAPPAAAVPVAVPAPTAAEGAPVGAKFCFNCGGALVSGARFCPGCGTKLGG